MAGREKKTGRWKYKKNWISRKPNELFKVKWKNMFHSFRRVFIGWKIKICEKIADTSLNDGKVKRNSFINECAEDETRFSKPIKI